MASGKSRLLNSVAWAGVLLLVLFARGASYQEDDPTCIGTSPRWEGVAGNLADGDLVFRTGRDIMSRLILSQGDSSRFSHVGVILRRGSGVVVVHALPQDGHSPGGVLVEPISVFASSDNASDIGFYRVKGVNANSRNNIREYVLRQVGKPFDDAFLLSEDEKLYCTELVLKAFAAAGNRVATSVPRIQIMLLAEPVMPPDYLRQSSQLQVVAPNLSEGVGTTCDKTLQVLM